MMSSLGPIGCSALMMLLVSLGTAVEVYDVNDDVEPDLAAYQDDDMASNFFRRQPNAIDVMLNRLVDSFAQNQLNVMQLRPSFRDMQGLPKFSEQKAISKRLPSALRSQPIRPQQKWKIKKGKTLGSQMVCYFKLCAFRSPH